MDYQEEYNQMMREGSNNQKRFQYIVIGIIAFVLGFGIAWVSFKSQNGVKVATDERDNNRVETVVETSDDMALGNENVEAETPVLSGGVSLAVDDQAPGQSVFVKEVSAPQAVWVVIRESVDGAHGNILGAGLFDPEDQAGLVNLLRGTAPGGRYFAVLHNEDSDLTQNRSFDLESDLALVDSEGNLIEVEFTTSAVPTE